MSSQAFYRQQEVEKRIGPCPVCGGRYSAQMQRHWHTGHPMICKRELNRRRLAAQEEASLRGGPDLAPICRHGFEDWTECPGCCEEADRTWKERGFDD